GEVTIDIGRRRDQPPRQAILTMRIAQLSICPPANRPDKASLSPIPVYMVLAEEYDAPSGVKPVCWLLLATFPVETFDDAIRCLRYYSYRWLIERYHFVLKSGCGLEKLQLETGDRIHRALATYSIVAWRLLWLTYEARHAPDSPCDKVLAPYEWQALYCYSHKTTTPPEKPPSLHEAVAMIAKLGGFLARKSDGEPGVKT
ncbi:MAG: IS4 family transposase, partial [Oceanicoccus sp.]|nr:IS4 family transposase [Oceanicoccus sp.]